MQNDLLVVARDFFLYVGSWILFGELSIVAVNNCIGMIFEKLFEENLDFSEGF